MLTMNIFYTTFVFITVLCKVNSDNVKSCFSFQPTTCAPEPEHLQNKTVVQGPPGKRGPVGLPGPVGLKGDKGQQGNCSCDQKEIYRLRQIVQNLTANTRGYKRLADGWVTTFNRYQYKITQQAQSWTASRSICQSWGGDLAVYGVQDMKSRRLIFQLLSITNAYIWIGLSDKDMEGSWVWVNGEMAVVPAAVLWIVNRPDSDGGNEDCGEIISTKAWGYGTNDVTCSHHRIALCEKTYSA